MSDREAPLELWPFWGHNLRTLGAWSRVRGVGLLMEDWRYKCGLASASDEYLNFAAASGSSVRNPWAGRLNTWAGVLLWGSTLASVNLELFIFIG